MINQRVVGRGRSIDYINTPHDHHSTMSMLSAELSKGVGAAARISAIQPELSQFFLALIFLISSCAWRKLFTQRRVIAVAARVRA